MANLGWSAPSHVVDAESAKRSILSQHRRIREHLSQARSVADAALDGDEPSPSAVANVIGDLRTIIEVHLDFEERFWLPVLELDDLMLGPERRAQQLLEEHGSQRTMLAALHQEARANPQLPLLAAKLAFLTSWLTADMEAEERELRRTMAPEGARHRAGTG